MSQDVGSCKEDCPTRPLRALVSGTLLALRTLVSGTLLDDTLLGGMLLGENPGLHASIGSTPSLRRVRVCRVPPHPAFEHTCKEREQLGETHPSPTSAGVDSREARELAVGPAPHARVATRPLEAHDADQQQRGGLLQGLGVHLRTGSSRRTAARRPPSGAGRLLQVAFRVHLRTGSSRRQGR